MELRDKIALDSKLLLDILENISTSVIVLNEDNSYFFVNIAGLDLLGISGKFPEFVISKINHWPSTSLAAHKFNSSGETL